LIALNDWIAGTFTHFIWAENPVDRRTVACLAQICACEWCGVVKNRRWKGYLGAVVGTMARPVLCEVTTAAWEETAALQEHDGHLRGTQWDVSRSADSTRAKMLFRKTLNVFVNPPLPPVDVIAVLARLWNQPREQLQQLFPGQDGEGGWGSEGFEPALPAEKGSKGKAEKQPELMPGKPPETAMPEAWKAWYKNGKKYPD
jgi:hypothetical protein